MRHDFHFSQYTNKNVRDWAVKLLGQNGLNLLLDKFLSLQNET